MTYREAAQIHWPPAGTIPRDWVAEWKEPLDTLDQNGALDDPAQKMSVDPEAEKAAYSLQRHRPLQTRLQDLAQAQAVSAQTMVVSPVAEVAEEAVEEQHQIRVLQPGAPDHRHSSSEEDKEQHERPRR